MVPALGRTLVVLVVGLLLFTNSMWLFPHANDETYTYERATIKVTNGTFSYHNVSDFDFEDPLGYTDPEINNLNAIRCQDPYFRSRACGIDLYLLTHGPVHVPMETYGASPSEFIHLDGEYYRRTHRKNESGSTYDVTHVPPRQLLATVAVNITGQHPGNPKSAETNYRLARSLAASGGTVTSFMNPEEIPLGSIYLRNGTYYTVIVTGYTEPDPPYLLTDPGRDLIGLGGLIAVVYGMVRLARGLTWKRD